MELMIDDSFAAIDAKNIDGVRFNRAHGVNTKHFNDLSELIKFGERYGSFEFVPADEPGLLHMLILTSER